MRTIRPICLLCAALTFGCGDDDQDPSPLPDPLAVTEVSPADAAEDVETGVAVTATFNRDIIPATMSPGTFVLRAGGAALTSAVTYDAAARTARLAAPLLPGTLYEAELTTEITDADGTPLSEAQEWSFTTRTWASGVVDQVGADPDGHSTSLAADESGRLHVAYRDNTAQDLRYATCASDCTSTANWTAITVDDGENVGQSASLAIDPDGGLHVIYADVDNLDVRYAVCTATCTTPENWTTATIDSVGNVTGFGSITADGAGQLHAVYMDFGNFQLKYATCAADCQTAEAWTSALLGDVGPGTYRAIVVPASNGRLHIAYPRAFNSTLVYGTCAAACTTAGNWTEIVLDEGAHFTPSMTLDEGGGLHLTYYDFTSNDLMYATCASQCDGVAGWTLLAVDQAGDVGAHTSLRRGDDGRLHVVYHDATNGELKYATCAAVCTAAASWRSAAVDQAGTVGMWTSAVLDGAGQLHAVYWDEGTAELKYVR